MLKLSIAFKKNCSLFFNSVRMCSTYPISVCQFTATNDKEKNLKIVKELVEESVAKSVKVVFLPEASDYISRDKDEFRQLAEPITGMLMSAYRELAKNFKVWISMGGFHEKLDESTVYNSHVLIDDNGDIKAIYRKLHLFDVCIPDQNIFLRESDQNVGGSHILGPVETPIGSLGLAICYDLRFPEQSTLLRKLGADVITYPSAFTSKTGQAHWEPLLRARAIENQCYVVAAAQYGKHNEKRTSYGHSMIVDPWGQIIAECPKFTEGTDTNRSIAVANVDLDFIKKVRQEMPVLSHRRNDIYSLNIIRSREEVDDEKTYYFADKPVPGRTVFFVSNYCFAFTNIRCVVPGHVLISTLRLTRRLQDLSQEEIADLFQTAVKVSKVIELAYGAQSSTVCVQDGASAGQTVPHVHVHILPRKEGDFANNDDIYLRLARHDKEANSHPIRSREEQIEEAQLLRKHFY